MESEPKRRDPRDEEAFRTAIGLARQVDKRDWDGFRALWDGSDDQDRVAAWLAAITATSADTAGKLMGITGDQWLQSQIDLYNGYFEDPGQP